MSSPQVSIGIPVYNEEEHLQEILATISAQTLGDFEAIISDNASTDATEQICREHCAHDSRFTYMCNRKNIGITANFNQVFEFSRGEYFKWWAADDLGAPTLVESCVDLLERDPGAVLAFGEGHFFKDDPTIPIGEPSQELMPAMDGDRRSRFRAAMFRDGRAAGAHPALVGRRDAIVSPRGHAATRAIPCLGHPLRRSPGDPPDVSFPPARPSSSYDIVWVRPVRSIRWATTRR